MCQSKEEGKVDGVTEMCLTRACLCVLRCLKEKKDWRVLGLVLEKVPRTLQNKGMLTRGTGGTYLTLVLLFNSPILS